MVKTLKSKKKDFNAKLHILQGFSNLILSLGFAPVQPLHKTALSGASTRMVEKCNGKNAVWIIGKFSRCDCFLSREKRVLFVWGLTK
jgi:hypothetical protein